MTRRKSIHIGEFKHANPIPNACRIGNLLMSGVILGRDPATGAMPETHRRPVRQHVRAHEGDRGGRRRHDGRHHQDDGMAAGSQSARAGKRRMAEDVSRRAFAPGASCAADEHGGRRAGAMRFHRRDRLTRSEEEPDMPTYLPFDPNPRRPSRRRRRRASTASFTCWARWKNIRCGRARPTRCRPRPGRRRCASTRRSASSAASSCRPRPMAPIIPWCSTALAAMGPNYRGLRQRAGVCRG